LRTPSAQAIWIEIKSKSNFQRQESYEFYWILMYFVVKAGNSGNYNPVGVKFQLKENTGGYKGL
jgi:hypothetical protein